jgi:molybdenum cofactor cytidylyltransferase
MPSPADCGPRGFRLPGAASGERVIAAVVLAAGLSRRMGRPKLLEDLAGRPVIRHAVEHVLAAGIAEVVVVVAPAHREAFAAALRGLPVRLAINPAPERGQAETLRIGVQSVPAGADAVLVALGDQPALPGDVIPGLVAALEATGADIAAPRYTDGRGNPVLFRPSVLPELAALTGDEGARAVIGRDPSRVALVPFAYPMPADIDTLADLAAARARIGRKLGVD